MKLQMQKFEEISNVLIENNENNKLYISKNAGMGYFSIETFPFDDVSSFRIKANSEDENEADVYKAFMELLDDILDNYLDVHFIRMQMDLKEKFIRTITRNSMYNTLEIRLDGEAMDVVVTIYRGEKCHNTNNRVFLENDGDLAAGYHSCFQTFLDKLVVIANREQSEDLRRK